MQKKKKYKVSQYKEVIYYAIAELLDSGKYFNSTK